jgi:hypothetical protein
MRKKHQEWGRFSSMAADERSVPDTPRPCHDPMERTLRKKKSDFFILLEQMDAGGGQRVRR